MLRLIASMTEKSSFLSLEVIVHIRSLGHIHLLWNFEQSANLLDFDVDGKVVDFPCQAFAQLLLSAPSLQFLLFLAAGPSFLSLLWLSWQRMDRETLGITL